VNDKNNNNNNIRVKKMTSPFQITISTTHDHEDDITFTTELQKLLQGKNVNIYISYFVVSKTSITL